MKAILKNKATRKNFLLIVGLIFILLIIIRLFVTPAFYPPEPAPIPKGLSYIEEILDKIFISLLVAVFTALFLFYVEIPEDEKKHEVIEPNLIKETFSKGRQDTDFWYFSGGTGRFTRAVTMGELSKISKERNEHRSLKIILLDPNNNKLCIDYASYRQFLKSSKNEWNVDYVKNEIVATICAAIIHKGLNPMLDINLYLKSNFSTLRIDLNSSQCVVTKEDSKEPALLVSKNTFLYRSYKEEILQLSKQCLEILVKPISKPPAFGSITATDIKRICDSEAVGIKLDELNYGKVADILNRNVNPYK